MPFKWDRRKDDEELGAICRFASDGDVQGGTDLLASPGTRHGRPWLADATGLPPSAAEAAVFIGFREAAWTSGTDEGDGEGAKNRR